ncbi:hypothetical protein AQ490_18955 [Wenjunlia vitaminophila]|uniref:Uncharacterized protein n=1 Tax=Wenjunlia vitaminophila TaxID=76728 RepID=A0A0T6LVB7_WENVI|nr:hypothetical protein [Wenjunlia vitaminophila]KRV49778.1 hypothetical protein AQ490_18955 [Wenjunlia vitaminophila]
MIVVLVGGRRERGTTAESEPFEATSVSLASDTPLDTSSGVAHPAHMVTYLQETPAPELGAEMIAEIEEIFTDTFIAPVACRVQGEGCTGAVGCCPGLVCVSTNGFSGFCQQP